MSDGVLITARLKSSRLKKKILLKFSNGDTIIEYLIKNLKKKFNKKKIVLITSKSNQDLILTKIAKKNGINFYRGHPQDVLDRMLQASKKFKFKNVISCTADNPLIDTNYASKILKYHKKKNNALTTNLSLPIGMFAYAVNIQSLKKVVRLKNSKKTETWVNYFKKINDIKVEDFKRPQKKITARLTIDYLEDFKVVNQVIEACDKKFPKFNDIAKLNRKNNKLFKINSHIVQKPVTKTKFKYGR